MAAFKTILVFNKSKNKSKFKPKCCINLISIAQTLYLKRLSISFWFLLDEDLGNST